MATAKITGTLSGSNNAKTFTITKLDAASNSIIYDNGKYSDTTLSLSTADGTYNEGYSSDVAKINATAWKKAADLQIAGPTLTEVTLGAGADTITAKSNGDREATTIVTGGGKDVIIAESGTTLTLTDFTNTTDVLRLGTNLDTTDIKVATSSGKNITVTLGSANDKKATLNVQNALGKKITIQNSTGGYLYEDTTSYGDEKLKTITDSSAGSLVSSASQYIDASGRKKAITIYASTETSNAPATQVIIGGAAADSIHATAGQNASVTSGKGADYIYIDSSTTAYKVTVTDYTVGDAKGADKLVFGNGLTIDTVKSGYQTEGDLKGHIAIIGTGTTSAQVTVDLGTSVVWNQTKPVETKALVFAIDSKGTVSAAYSNPAELVITDKAVKYNAKKPEETIIDLNATIGAAKTDTIAFGTKDKPFDTDTTRAFNFSNIAGPIYLKNTTIGDDEIPIDITGSKGKDTLKGAGGATLDGSAGNDLIITAAGDTGTGGAGNDTLRGDSNSAYLIGGAGNDVFALAGAGGIITDYYSGRFDATDTKDSNKATKKELGSDKLVVSYDKFNANGALGRYKVQFTGYDDEGEGEGEGEEITLTKLEATSTAGSKQSDLTIAVSGQVWVPGDTVAASEADSRYVHTTYTQGTGALAYFKDSSKATDAEKAAQVYEAGHFGYYTSGTYTLKDALGKAVTFVTEGTTYQQTVSADTSFTVTQSFHAALAPNAKEIKTADSVNKAVKIVGGTATTVITGGKKNDTLVGNSANATLTGGAGNDVYMGTGYVADYNATGKDKIAFTREYPDTTGNAFNDIDFADGKTDVIKAGDLTIKLGSGDITFNNIYNTETQAKLKSSATATTAFKMTEKKVTDAMIRGFGTASSVVAFAKGSTHAFVGGNIDSGVAIIDASKTGKNTYIVNNANYVQSIVGSAKNDTIRAGSFVTNAGTKKYYGGTYISDTAVYNSTTKEYSEQVTVATGKGNDIIVADGAAYITDFTATKAKTKNNALTGITGDALYIYEAAASDVSVASTALTAADSDKIQGTNALYFTFGDTYETKDDVIIGSTTLKGMKGKQVYIYTGSDATGVEYADDPLDTAKLAAGNMATLNNLHEYVVEAKGAKKGDVIDATKAAQVTATGNGVDASDVTIIDASAHGKGADITAGNYVKTIYAGKGADTVHAGSDTTVYTGAGADVLVFDSVVAGKHENNKFFTVADYTLTDRIVLGAGVGIKTAATAGGDGAKPVYNKKGTSIIGTNNYSDVTLTLVTIGADGSVATGGLVVKFTDLVANSTSGLKITRQLGTNAKDTFALDYFSTDVTVGAADGNVIDFTGANAKNVSLAAARSKAVTLQGIANEGTTIFGTTGKAAITYIAGSKGVTFNGSSKADIYQGGAASDVVVFTAGNNTVLGGGTGGSSIALGSGNEVLYVKASDTFKVSGYTAGKDSFVLDTVFGADAFVGASKAAAGDTLVTAKKAAAGDLLITFGSGDTLTTVNFGTTLGDNKVTIKLGTTKGGKLAAGATIFQGGFGTNMTYADADGTTINAQYNPFATAITADSNAKAKHYLTVGTASNTKVADMVGGKGADTLVANYGVNKLTGGNGNDVFVISSDTAITITDFNTGKDVLDFKTNAANGTAGLANFKVEDYGENYKLSGNDLVLDIGSSTVTLKDVVSSGATSAIRYLGNDDQSKNGVVLHDKEKIVLAKSATKTDFTAAYFSDTTEFDASANSGAIKFGTASYGDGVNGKLTTFKSGKGGAEVVLTANGTNAVTYTDGGGNDKVALGTGKVTFTYAGGSDEFTSATKDNLQLNKGDWEITGASNVTTISGGNKASAATFNLKKGNTTGTIKVTGATSGGDFFTLSYGQAVKGSEAGKVGGNGTDSDTMKYNYSRELLISGAGFQSVVFGTQNAQAAAKEGEAKFTDIFASSSGGSAPYDEQFNAEYSVITSAETLFGGDSLTDITTPTTTSIDISSLDFSTEAVGGFKAGDLTFDTSLTTQKTRQDK